MLPKIICMTKIPLRTINYQWESLLYRENSKQKKEYKKKFGTTIITRDVNKKAQQVKFTIYSTTKTQDIYLVGECNNWGEDITNLENYKLEKKGHSGFFSIITEEFSHKDPYLFLVKDLTGTFLLRDPAAVFFDDKGNSVFWDYKDPGTYKQKYESPNTLHRATKILQTDMHGLVAKWYEFDSSAKPLAETKKDLFSFVATCGVLDKIKELGFNTIQFLPLAQSIDGDNWKFRYLVPYAFALQKNWGNPDTFTQLVDECHKRGIAVIVDLILSHAPYKDYHLFGLPGEDVGIHCWQGHEGDVYLDELTPWGTKRFRYGDMNIRQYLVESALHFLTNYSIDGFRIDNVDGILRYGDAGQGDERPYGRLFLRELIAQVYEQNPLAIINLESHYFYGDNPKLLVGAQSTNPRALGATAYTSSRLTYFFHTEFMPKAIEDVSIWRFEHIRKEKEWGLSNSTIADFHNHDAAAGLMAERATGSYAYDALILKRPELTHHAIGKIKIMETIISCGCEGRTLDLLQTFLLQTGSFEHDSSIHWNLLNKIPNKKVVAYKKAINNLLEDPAFWPENTLYREYTNVDEQNKVLVIKREDKTRERKNTYYCIINLSNNHLQNYAIGVHKKGTYTLVLDSDVNDYAGTQSANIQQETNSQESNHFKHFSQEIVFPTIGPYHCIIIKKR